MQAWFSVRQAAEHYGLDIDKIYALIRGGAIRAINTTEQGDAKRPRYRISRASLDAFEKAREVRTPEPPRPQTRRRKNPNVIEFFK